MRRIWNQARERLGNVALAALGLLAAGVVFLTAAIRPLETRLEQLVDRMSTDARQSTSSTRHGSPSVQLAAFYGYFDRPDDQVDWLARLYGTTRHAGLELRTADYRLVETDGRIARYEIALPLTGTYTQLRTFIALALDENPILSLDQISLRRKRVNDSVVEADAVFTIHLLKP